MSGRKRLAASALRELCRVQTLRLFRMAVAVRAAAAEGSLLGAGGPAARTALELADDILRKAGVDPASVRKDGTYPGPGERAG